MFLPPTTTEVLTSSYNLGLVLLSYIIAVITSYAALNLFSNLKQSSQASRIYWLIACGFCLGGGVWSMHFIGMLAFNLSIPVNYDVPTTIFSLTIVIAAASIAFFILNLELGLGFRIIMGGVLMGTGIATMHYSGMAAMLMQAVIHYDSILFILSIFIAISASMVTLWLAIHFHKMVTEHKNLLLVAASLIMGIAIVGMHYTGMAATRFVPDADIVIAEPNTLNTHMLVALISAVIIFSLGLAITASMMHTAKQLREREKAHEEALKELAQQKELILSTSEEGIYGVDAYGNILFINSAALQLLGYRSEELAGKSLHTLIHHTRLDGTPYPEEHCPANITLKTGRVLRITDEIFWKKDGTCFPVDYTCTPIMENGNSTGAVIRFRDITQWKENEKKLLQKEQQLNSIMNYSSNVIYLKDLKGRYLLINQSWKNIFEVTDEEVIGKTDLEIFPKDIAEAFMTNDKNVMRTGLPLEVEEVAPLADGLHNYISFKCPLRDSNGAIYGMFGISTDITERIKMETALRESYEKLEERVEQRTEELRLSNEKLKKEVDQRQHYVLALEDSETRFRQIAENVDEVFWMEDPSGKQSLYISPAFEKVWGLPCEELTKNPQLWLELIHPEDRNRVEEEYNYKNRALTVENKFDSEYRIIRPDGDIRWIRDRSFPVRDNQGNIIRIAGIASDVTEHKLAVKMHSRFGRILDESSNEIYLFDASTLKFTMVNRGARHNLSYSMEELKDLTPLDLKPEFTREQFEEMIRPLRDGTKTNVIFETIHRRKDGTDYPVEVNLQLSKQDSPPQFMAIIQDVTERNKAKATIQKSEKQYQLLHTQMESLLEETSTSTGVDFLQSIVKRLAFALKTRYAFVGMLTNHKTIKTLAIWANDGFTENFEYPLAGTPCEFVTEKKVYSIPENLQGYYPDNNRLVQMDVSSYMATPLVDSTNKIIGILFVMHDAPMTDSPNFEEILKIFASRTETEIERQRIEKELENSYKQLLHSDKLITAGKMSAQFAHEFNNPLGCVHSVLEQVREGVSMSEEYQELMEVAVKESQRMKGLIQKLVTIHQPTPGIREAVNIHDILNEVLLLRKLELNGSRVKIQKSYFPEIPKVPVIPDQIKQVFLNLIQNALDALPDQGGTITLATDFRDEAIAISIQDTGSGIEPDTLNSIFDPFVTTKGPNQGTGLGLTVCYGIIRAHGGEITVQSNPGTGSTFTIVLPTGGKDQ